MPLVAVVLILGVVAFELLSKGRGTPVGTSAAVRGRTIGTQGGATTQAIGAAAALTRAASGLTSGSGSRPASSGVPAAQSGFGQPSNQTVNQGAAPGQLTAYGTDANGNMVYTDQYHVLYDAAGNVIPSYADVTPFGDISANLTAPSLFPSSTPDPSIVQSAPGDGQLFSQNSLNLAPIPNAVPVLDTSINQDVALNADSGIPTDFTGVL